MLLHITGVHSDNVDLTRAWAQENMDEVAEIASQFLTAPVQITRDGNVTCLCMQEEISGEQMSILQKLFNILDVHDSFERKPQGAKSESSFVEPQNGALMKLDGGTAGAERADGHSKPEKEGARKESKNKSRFHRSMSPETFKEAGSTFDVTLKEKIARDYVTDKIVTNTLVIGKYVH